MKTYKKWQRLTELAKEMREIVDELCKDKPSTGLLGAVNLRLVYLESRISQGYKQAAS